MSAMSTRMLVVVGALAVGGCAASLSSRDAGADDGATDAGAQDRPAVDAPTLAGRLPDGVWRGTLTRMCSDGTTAAVTYETSIAANVQRTDFASGGIAGTSVDRYTFTAPDAAVWHDLQGGELGRCTRAGTVFSCRVTADAAVQARRTLDFAGGSLVWDEENSLEGVTCRVRGTLRP